MWQEALRLQLAALGPTLSCMPLKSKTQGAADPQTREDLACLSVVEKEEEWKEGQKWTWETKMLDTGGGERGLLMPWAGETEDEEKRKGPRNMVDK